MVTDAAGIYLPQSFIQQYEGKEWGVKKEDEEILEAGPDEEYYWEVWDEVLRDASFTDSDGKKWTLYQEGDLFAVPEDFDWDEYEG